MKFLKSTTLLLLSAPLFVVAEPCQLAFSCGDDRHCFGMRGYDGAGLGTAKATICVSLVQDRYLEATVTPAPGYTLTRSNIWVGEDLDSVPTKDGEPDWKMFPHKACDFGGKEELTQTFRLMKAEDIPTDGTKFTDFLVARAEIQANGGEPEAVYAYQQHEPHAALELESTCPLAGARSLRGRITNASRSL